ncbi:chromosome segregation protein SMC [Pseudothauera nasutitermitis]|uniref:Chromosome segregation protein SMC n=1 Tax=Pseudothauera nasutitermitis TaxID=2565930 RepID=A0A4S4B7U6_9RHOO|nr:AAA family ATPase [Pseudothauera nasutitermitis]THF67083.1 chromosome segregation protein SMC [Pseudothauera nasutitermitis]
MFHIKQLELVHWDYWRRFSLPLDAQIITIVGPNGSGKTTLLDALRTLFALRCSGKRDFRRYVRRADRSFAWIRAVVANQPGSSGRRPFFPCLHDEVTLSCRIRRASGEWTRDYTIVDGDVPIEELERTEDWIGLRDYQSRLAWGGLTPAIAKVLALEQGDTDKLCEYSPKALLELVFDVFGDKEVLDNYEAAREEQKSAEHELDDLGLDLDRLRAQAEARRLEADNYLQWKQLADEAHALEAEIVPRLEAAELARDAGAERQQLAAEKTERAARHTERRQGLHRLEEVRAEKSAAEAERTRLKQDGQGIETAYLAARDRVRDLEKLLAERAALRTQLETEHGADAVALEREHEEAEAALARLRARERELVGRFEERSDALRTAKNRGGAPSDPEVARFRALLDEQGIAHQGLAEVVEVTDAAWQAALEAVLRPYRHVVLLEREADRHAAWALGERERFRHFVVPERESAPPARAQSLAEVVNFSAPVPRWLTDLINRIRRVDSVEAARNLPRDVEWITRDAYHRERRGARHLGRPADFHFGELARQARIAQLEEDIRELDRQLAEARPQVQAAADRLTALRARLLGLQSAQLLAAKAEAYAAAEAELPQARGELATASEARSQIEALQEKVGGQLAGIQIEIERRGRELNAIEQRLAELDRDTAPRRHAQAQRLKRLRSLRRGMPAHWRDPAEIALLAEKYESAAGARRERDRLRTRLAEGDWVTDPAVLTVSERLKADVNKREQDYRERQGYCATTRRLTEEARNAYIAKLRATVRQYGKNLKALGELAGVGVDCPPPALGADDLSLAQAGLEVRFDFDRKGAVGLNDGEASGGQQVMKSLILLIALLMDDARPGGFVFIDEPFAHLDVANIDRVGTFLRATRAQYLITTPVTHNANVFAPAQLTLVTRKKKPGDDWAPTIGILARAV